MKILKNFESNREIKTINDWFRECPPKKKEEHWVDGRSAKELARYMTSNLPEVPFEIKSILAKYSSAEKIIIAPEFVTSFEAKGFGSGEGRNHDSLVLMQDAVVGIEAKVDEGLGKYYSDIKIDDKPNHQLRYRGLYGALFDESIDGKIRYQVVSASVGTIMEAVDRKKSKAVLLIITFTKDGFFDEGKVKNNLADIEYFVSKFEKNTDGSLQAKIAINHNIQFYIEHIRINLV